MRLEVKSRDGAVPDAVREYAEKKVKKLDRYFHSIQTVSLEQAVERGRCVIQLSVDGDGVLLRSQVREKDPHTAVDSAIEKMETQVKRFKARLRHDHHRPGPVKEAVAASVGVEPEESTVPRVQRRKRYSLKPMSPQEAATQMEMVGHDFFLFLNDETGSVSVLYRRQAGGYGVIEPEQ